MKRRSIDRVSNAARVGITGILLFGIGGCVSWDGTKEVVFSFQERPTIEAALDRINTAARVIEIGDLMIHALPISGGSEWPRKVDGSVPMVEESSLRQSLQRDPSYYSGTPGQISSLKIKALYLQTQLFAKYPDLHASRKMGAAASSEAEVNALATQVLGPGHSPTFTKNFYWFRQYYPDFVPKPDLFSGRLNGKATEVYPSLLDAVLSLAENKSEIVQFRESVLQAEEKKAKARRNILELSDRIQKLETAEFGTPATAEEAVQASERDTNAKEVEDLKGQLAVQEVEFKATVTAYKEELEKMGIEMAKIKTQALAFNPEQRALAANIQIAVDAVLETMRQSEILLGIAAYQIKEAGPKWKSEVQDIFRQGGQFAGERIKRITLNLVALPTNLSVLKAEFGVLNEEAKVHDDLFTNRVSIDTGGEGGGGLDWLTRFRSWFGL